MNEEELLAGLNAVQRDAAAYTEGPVLIIAGAGSGKTRVLTTRVALLLARGVQPERILALTFTKKAAGEMRQRVESSQGEAARMLCMGTFHSVFVRLMRPHAAEMGYPDSFTILDEDESLSCMKQAVAETVFRDYGKPSEDDEETAKRRKQLEARYKPKIMLSRVSLAKNDGMTAEDYLRNGGALDADETGGVPLFKDIFLAYSQRCRQMGAMDFDDILLNMDRLLDSDPRDITGRFEYILVDEYQDTNRIQYSILRKLTRDNDNICVVGDDSQSIYAFRGARIQNIFNFARDYPGAALFKLEQNYRSTRTIVDAANRLIENNGGRIPKVCFSEGEQGDAILFDEAETERDEASLVAEAIARSVRLKGGRWSDHAVLYRTNAQSRAIEDALIRRRVPYVIYSGTSFFDRMEVKDLMAYLKLAVNPREDEAFRRICNRPARGISQRSLDILTDIARDTGGTLLDTCTRDDLAERGMPAKAAAALRAFGTLMDTMWETVLTDGAYEAVKKVAVSSGLMDLYLSDTSEEGRRRVDNLREMLDGVASFAEEYAEDNPGMKEEVRVPEYIENMMLLTNADTRSGDGDHVSVMTAHCAKGLEYDTVFVTGLENGLFPLRGDELTQEETEEERRLLYVAVTRARRHLHLTCAKRRMQFGKRCENGLSPFLPELLPDEFEFEGDGDEDEDIF